MVATYDTIKKKMKKKIDDFTKIISKKYGITDYKVCQFLDEAY